MARAQEWQGWPFQSCSNLPFSLLKRAQKVKLPLLLNSKCHYGVENTRNMLRRWYKAVYGSGFVLYFSLGKELTWWARWSLKLFCILGEATPGIRLDLETDRREDSFSYQQDYFQGLFSLSYALCCKESILQPLTPGTGATPRHHRPQAKTLLLCQHRYPICWMSFGVGSFTQWPKSCYTVWERNSDMPVGSVVALLLLEQDVLGFHLAPAGCYANVRR